METGLTKVIMLHCERELQESEEYIKLQKGMTDAYKERDIDKYSELSIMMQMVVEKIIYKLATRDLFELLKQ